MKLKNWEKEKFELSEEQKRGKCASLKKIRREKMAIITLIVYLVISLISLYVYINNF